MQIFLRSQNCTSRDDDSGYTWLYPTPVRFGEPGDDIQVCVSLLQWFPILRNVDGTNEYLDINPTDPDSMIGAAFWTTVFIPRGNYNVNDICTLITDAFKDVSDAQYRLVASFDDANLQLVIKRPAGAPSNLIAIKGSDRILRMLGFTGEPTTYYMAWPPWDPPVPAWTATDELRSQSIVNFAGPTHALVETSLQTTNVQDETLSSSVLCKVPIVGHGFGELQTYQDTSTFSTLADHEISSLTVRFRDSFGSPIDFGDIPWNMTLLFKLTPRGVYRPLTSNYSPPPDQTKDNGDPTELPDPSAQS